MQNFIQADEEKAPEEEKRAMKAIVRKEEEPTESLMEEAPI